MFITPWRNGNEKIWREILKLASKIKTENDLSKLLLNVYHLTTEFDADVGGDDVAKNFSGANKNVRISSASNLSESDPFESDPTENSSEAASKIFEVDLDHDADAILTIAKKVARRNGVFGVDVLLETLFRDFIFLPQDGATTVSVVDKSTSKLIYHPFLIDRIHLKVSPLIGQVHFGQIESEKLFRHIVENSSGNFTSKKSTHVWHQVPETDFVVVISSSLAPEAVDADRSFKASPTPTMTTAKLPLFFHRLDVLPTKQQSKLCRHFVSPATLESGTLYMSTDAFLEPWERPRVIRSLVIFYILPSNIIPPLNAWLFRAGNLFRDV